MEIISNEAIICKEVQIADFSNYKYSADKLESNFEINTDKFRSRWTLIVYPMKSPDEHMPEIECDVALSLQCTFSTSPIKYLEHIQIESWIESRERYPSEMQKHVDAKTCVWNQNLISRIALKACTFSVNNVLSFFVKFTIPQVVLGNCFDGAAELAQDLNTFCRKVQNWDVYLSTGSETMICSNRTILKARSKLLETCEQISEESCSDMISATSNVKRNLAAQLRVNTPVSPFKSSKNSPSSKPNFLPRQNPFASPRKRTAASLLSPSKLQSPSKRHTQTTLTNFLVSPPAKSEQALCSSSTTPNQENIVPSTTVKTEALSVLEQEQMKKFSNSSSVNNEEKPSRCYKVNMSVSVANAVIEWIYTGETSKLCDLAVPLLVAALRHHIPGLSQACQNELASTLNMQNVSRLLQMSLKYDAAFLKEKALDFSLQNAAQVTACEDWQQLLCSNPKIMMEFTRRLSVRVAV